MDYNLEQMLPIIDVAVPVAKASSKKTTKLPVEVGPNDIVIQSTVSKLLEPSRKFAQRHLVLN